jgi:hypothetical protein
VANIRRTDGFSGILGDGFGEGVTVLVGEGVVITGVAEDDVGSGVDEGMIIEVGVGVGVDDDV